MSQSKKKLLTRLKLIVLTYKTVPYNTLSPSPTIEKQQSVHIFTKHHKVYQNCVEFLLAQRQPDKFTERTPLELFQYIFLVEHYLQKIRFYTTQLLADRSVRYKKMKAASFGNLKKGSRGILCINQKLFNGKKKSCLPKKRLLKVIRHRRQAEQPIVP